MLIQAFVFELAVKAFHKGVLGQFTMLDKAKLNTGFLAPEEHALLENSVPLSQITFAGFLRCLMC